MSPVKKRRRLPTLINRGLGLLEVVMPNVSREDAEGILPSGHRDETGFWLPDGCETPSDLFSAAQKRMQENQRRIQQQRMQKKDQSPPAEQDGKGAGAAPKRGTAARRSRVPHRPVVDSSNASE